MELSTESLIVKYLLRWSQYVQAPIECVSKQLEVGIPAAYGQIEKSPPTLVPSRSVVFPCATF